VAYKNLFISEQLDESTFTIAKEKGVVAVINLRDSSEFTWDEEADAAKNAGLGYYNITIASTGDSFDPKAIQINDLM
jgi:protein tyrosine phosphatase (PTP) superfamily phosphohydrolase (DUF442 family)